MKRQINPNTKLNIILDLDPKVVDYIVSLNPHDFQRLHNPLMRKFMSPRISIGRVAAMVGQPISALLNRIAELTEVEVAGASEETRPQSPTDAPAWAEALSPDDATITLNLLPIDETLDADPMPPISRAIKQLATGDVLLIRHKWEPQPLYDIWSQLGTLEWYARQIHADEWWIWVKRTG
jgi:hypothetical protein